jgi:hypothetical protein
MGRQREHLLSGKDEPQHNQHFIAGFIPEAATEDHLGL